MLAHKLLLLSRSLGSLSSRNICLARDAPRSPGRQLGGSRSVSRIRGRVGAFFVGKKDGNHRLVLDCREVNLQMRSPPLTPLAGPGALQTLDISPEALLLIGVPAEVVSEGPGLYGAGVDMCDGFYQNLMVPSATSSASIGPRLLPTMASRPS